MGELTRTGEIKRLPDDLINKIAAGEVVERPASVVKELVENALDAGATRIEIELREGGLELIRVTDNGHGISREDLPLAFERHATSKIQSDGDLFNLHTMGFRGEALASIAAVSKFKILTYQLNAATGSRLAVEGGREQCLEDWTHPVGTSVVVEDLFFNIPARRNFLKNAHGEYAHVLEWIQALALAQPHIGFKLIHNDRVSLDLESRDHATSDGEVVYRSRVAEVLKAQGEGLLTTETSNEYCSLRAFFSAPGKDRSHSGSMYIFINDRWVQNKNLRFAILRGYHSHLMKGRFPVTVLYLRLDPSLVDVNVHPAKTEVRLQYLTEVQNLIAISIREKLREGNWGNPTVPSNDASDISLQSGVMRSGATSENPPNLESFEKGIYPRAKVPSMPFVPRDFQSVANLDGSRGSSFSTSSSYGLRSLKGDSVGVESLLQSDSVQQQITKGTIYSERGSSMEDLQCSERELFAVPGTATEAELPDFDEMNFLGCFSKCFLFFEYQERLLCLDQHAFHERILYEKLTKETQILESSQPMLIPELVEMRPTQVASLIERKSLLEGLGFGLTQIAPDSIEIHAVPAFLSRVNLETTLVSLVTNLQRGENGTSAEQIEAMHHILSTLACHGAVRAGDELTEAEIRTLFAQSRTVDFWQNCPHGRPVLKWFNKRDVESWFSR